MGRSNKIANLNMIVSGCDRDVAFKVLSQVGSHNVDNDHVGPTADLSMLTDKVIEACLVIDIVYGRGSSDKLMNGWVNTLQGIGVGSGQ